MNMTNIVLSLFLYVLVPTAEAATLAGPVKIMGK